MDGCEIYTNLNALVGGVEVPEDGGENEAGDHHGRQTHEKELRRALDVLPRPPHQHGDLRPRRIRERAHCVGVCLPPPHHVRHLPLRRRRLRCQQLLIQQHVRHGRPGVGKLLLHRRRGWSRFRFPRFAKLHQGLDSFLWQPAPLPQLRRVLPPSCVGPPLRLPRLCNFLPTLSCAELLAFEAVLPSGECLQWLRASSRCEPDGGAVQKFSMRPWRRLELGTISAGSCQDTKT